MENIKRTFAVRLQQYAERLDRIEAAIARVAGIDDENYSPSKYTPCLRESREQHARLLSRLSGYCVAVDDALQLEHGDVERRLYDCMEKGVHRIKEYECVDDDSGYNQALDEARSVAVDRLLSALKL